MKVAKKTAEYTVYKRSDGRYAVQSKNKAFINGEDKVNILMKEGFLTAPKPKTAEPIAEATNSEEAETPEN